MIFESEGWIPLKPKPEPCRLCGVDTRKVDHTIVCDCDFSPDGDLLDDCGACSDGVLCMNCYDWGRGVEIRVMGSL